MRSIEATKQGLITFLIELADVAPKTRFGKVKRFEYYGNNCYLVEFYNGPFAVQTFFGEIHIAHSYEEVRQHVPPMVIPIHYPGDFPDSLDDLSATGDMCPIAKTQEENL